MSIIVAILLAFLAFLVGYFSRRPAEILNQERNHETELRLENIEEALQRVDDKFEVLSLSPAEEVEVVNRTSDLVGRFESASEITLADVKKWKPKQIMKLITQRYDVPGYESVFEEFEYRHDHIEGNEVHGFWRDQRSTPSILDASRSGLDDWDAFRFLASQEECTTTSGTGWVRLSSIKTSP